MSCINREEAIRQIMDYVGGAMDKPTAIEILKQLPEENLQPTCNKLATDYISRGTAIEAVSNIKRSSNWPAAIAVTLAELPSASIPHWIPCSERLPDNCRQVLVTYKWAEDDYEPSIAEYWGTLDGWGKNGDKVIAWAEMPEPYREATA